MRKLASAYAALNAKQAEAIDHPGNTLVLAGPGSGKTETVVVKVGKLLTEEIEAPRAVACITFGNSAVEEFRGRLERLGVHPGHRLYLGSVHSFCLNCVVRPFGHVVNPRFKDVRVTAERSAGRLLEEIAQRHDPDTRRKGSKVTQIRRRRACGEPVNGFAAVDLTITNEYEAALSRTQLLDFEGIVIEALQLIEGYPWIRRMIVARYPRLVVDEYQDLGGPLHKIVSSLVDASATLFAVGDPDQTVYQFQGANPKYLESLRARGDVHSVQLRFNYRSGGDLILASQAALAPATPRDYEPDPKREDRGSIYFLQAEDSLTSHAAKTVDAVRRFLAEGIPAHEIAIFYHASWQLYPELRETLSASGLAVNDERGKRFRATPVTDWLQLAAAWATTARDMRDPDFGRLAGTYRELLARAGSDDGDDDLACRERLYKFLQSSSGEAPLHEWVEAADRTLELRSALRLSRADDDLEALDELCQPSTGGDEVTPLADFAVGGRKKGSTILTTLHSAKGRQFDAVILPGLVEGVMPFGWTWNRSRRRDEPPSEEALAESRRLFYVGITRARHAVVLVWSNGFLQTNRGGTFLRSFGRSRFVNEIQKRLEGGG